MSPASIIVEVGGSRALDPACSGGRGAADELIAAADPIKVRLLLPPKRLELRQCTALVLTSN